MTALDSRHCLFEILHGEPAPCFTARESSSGAVRGRMIGHFILQAGDNVAARCHGSGNYALLARFHLDCAFPCYPYVLIEVVFSLRKRSEERRVGKEGRSRWSPYQ